MNKEAKEKLKYYETIKSYHLSQLEVIRSLKNILLQRWVKDEINDVKLGQEDRGSE